MKINIKKISTKELTITAMLCALAYAVMLIGRIPLIEFLKYDPKDVIITIGGFIYGPLTAFVMSLIVSFAEMITVSDTGWIGLLMNVISTCAFSCTAAFVYKKRHVLSGAVTGLILGCVVMTAAMLLWNYYITPFYLLIPREAVAEMLVPVFLPFNLIKSGANTALTLLIYKPTVTALRSARLLAKPSAAPLPKKKGVTLGITLTALVALVTFVLFVLVINDII